MPIYEYTCDECQCIHEILQKFDELAPEACPKCHALGSLKKVVSNSAFHLKGSGWYKDLYSSKPAEKKAEDKSDKKSDDK